MRIRRLYLVLATLLLVGSTIAAYRLGVAAGEGEDASHQAAKKAASVDKKREQPPKSPPTTDQETRSPSSSNEPWAMLSDLAAQDQQVDVNYTEYFWRTNTVEQTDSSTTFDAWCIYEYADKHTESKLLGRFSIRGRLATDWSFASDACARLR